jgi:hypothetical protein
MRIGLCGAHRTGKTTLATQVAEQLGIMQVKSSVSSIAASYNFNMDTDRRDNPLFARMQRQILVTLCDSYGGKTRFVSDRTPLDAAAYLLCDVQADNGDDEWRQMVQDYTSKALAATEMFFDAIILVPPAIPFDPMDGKPGANPAYQEHLHLVCAGLLGELTIPCAQLPRDCVGLQERTNLVVEMANVVADKRAAKSGLIL